MKEALTGIIAGGLLIAFMWLPEIIDAVQGPVQGPPMESSSTQDKVSPSKPEVTFYRRIIVTSPCSRAGSYRGIVEVYTSTWDWRQPTYIHPQLERRWGRKNILRRLAKLERTGDDYEANKYIEAVSRSFKCEPAEVDVRQDLMTITKFAREVDKLPDDAFCGELVRLIGTGDYYGRVMGKWVKLELK